MAPAAIGSADPVPHGVRLPDRLVFLGRCPMQLPFLLALVLAFSSLLSVEGRPVATPDVQLVGSALACALFLALSWWTGQIRQHLGPDHDGPMAKWLHWGERWHGVAYVAVVAVAFGWFDFAEIVHSNWQLRRMVWADDAVIVLALSLPLLGGWLLDPLTPPTQQRRSRSISTKAWGLRDVGMRARHAMLLPLVPILLITGIADLERLFRPANASSVGTPLAVLALVGIACTLPWLLRYCWPTRPLESGPARSLIEATLAEAGVNVRQILRWETHGRMANAAMTGFLPSLRYLLVSDELLRRMTGDDLRAITAHEAAHCRYGHLPRLGLSLIIPFVVLSMAEPLFLSTAWASLASTPLVVITVLGLWSFWHGRWARLLEHHADLAACRLLSHGSTIELEAVDTLDGALRKAGASSSGDWLHPSPAARIALLLELAGQPSAEAAFERRMRATFRAQSLVIVGLLLVWFWSL
jgi:Zn-dependent protease with chaperone function